MNQGSDQDNILDRAIRDGSFYQNPYPIYRELRSTAPILWSNIKEGYYVTTHRHIENIINQYPLYKKITSSLESINNSEVRSQALDFIAIWPFYRNDDYQEEKTKAQHFINSNTKKVNGYLERLDFTRPYCNLVDSLFIPIALTSVMRVMGVHEREFDNIKRHSKFILRLMQNDLDTSEIPHLTECIHYFQELYAQYPYKDIMGYGMFCNLLIDGYEPLAQTLTFSTLMYVKHSPQKSHIQGFVNEVLRMFPSFQYLVRYAERNIELDGLTIPKDAKLYLIVASANRDETLFEESDEFLFKRTKKNHWSFGRGKHGCMGGRLTYQVATTFIKAIMKGKREIQIDRHSRLVKSYTGTLFVNELQGSIN